MQFKLNLEYKRTAELIEKMSDAEITLDYIQYAVKMAHPEGLTGIQRRCFGRIQRKMDEVVDTGGEYVELDASEFDFIKTSFQSEKTRFDPILSKFVNVLEEEIERCSKL